MLYDHWPHRVRNFMFYECTVYRTGKSLRLRTNSGVYFQHKRSIGKKATKPQRFTHFPVAYFNLGTVCYI
jgi:hypothetical protein